MALSITEQLSTLVAEKKHILITFAPTAGGDAIGSALALFGFLSAIGKRADIVASEFKLPRQFSFLQHSERVAASLSEIKTFIMTLDIKDTGVQELSYDLVGEKLRIFVTPKQGILNKENVKTAESSYKYDLVIVLGTQDLVSLGTVYQKHGLLFEETPVINIDCDPRNERFGHTNIVDVTATSTAEVVYDLLKQWKKEHISTEIATALLTGMIAKTHSFRGEHVKPHTLSVAGTLINLGADRDYIVQNLYRTRTIASLRLWGEALRHLHIDKDLGLVTTSITRDDFTRSGAHTHDLVEIIDELISNSPEAKLILLCYEDPDDTSAIHATVSTTPEFDAAGLIRGLNPVGNQERATCTLRDKTLKEVEEVVSGEMRKNVAQLYS